MLLYWCHHEERCAGFLRENLKTSTQFAYQFSHPGETDSKIDTSFECLQLLWGKPSAIIPNREYCEPILDLDTYIYLHLPSSFRNGDVHFSRPPASLGTRPSLQRVAGVLDPPARAG
jgi:hypothetical protein